jgi:hypothetical protein
VLESLAQLVHTSLVRRTRGGRFELASALRMYSRELLEASGERDAPCRRHAEAVVADCVRSRTSRAVSSSREWRGRLRLWHNLTATASAGNCPNERSAAAAVHLTR